MKCTSVFDKDKRFNPTYDAKITTRIDCDTVIIAIGQATDLSVLSKDSQVKATRGGWLIADPVTLATDEDGYLRRWRCGYRSQIGRRSHRPRT